MHMINDILLISAQWQPGSRTTPFYFGISIYIIPYCTKVEPGQYHAVHKDCPSLCPSAPRGRVQDFGGTHDRPQQEGDRASKGKKTRTCGEKRGRRCAGWAPRGPPGASKRWTVQRGGARAAHAVPRWGRAKLRQAVGAAGDAAADTPALPAAARTLRLGHVRGG